MTRPLPQAELVRGFLNTVDLESPQDGDAFGTLEQANHRLQALGLPAVESEDDRRRLAAFREALREVTALNGGAGDSGQSWAGLWAYAGGARYRLIAAPGGGFALESQGRGADAAIGELLGALHQAMTAGTWSRLKVCRKGTCRRAFYDRSKNGSGVWCSMAVCGNRAKAQRRRRRLKAAAISA